MDKMEDFVNAANRFIKTPEGQELLRKLEADGGMKRRIRAAEQGKAASLSAADRAEIFKMLRENPQVMEKMKEVMKDVRK